jgi:hypothetical protein
MTIRAFLVAVLLAVCVRLSVSAQPATPRIYFLGTTDRNGDGVSDLSDGVSLYAVTGNSAERISADGESVRSSLPDWERGNVAYLAAAPDARMRLTLAHADGSSASIPLTGLQAPLLRRCADTIWISARDAGGKAVLIGYDLTLAEVARVAVELNNPTFAFDPTGQWATGYDQSAQTLQLYRLPGLKLTPLPQTVTPWGPPIWARQSARFALPIRDGNTLRMAVIDPAATVNTSGNLGLFPDQVRLVQAQWSASERYLTYRTLPGADLAAPLALTLIDANTLALTRFAESDTQLRVVAWSGDDSAALVSESSAALSNQISVNDRLYDPVANAIKTRTPVSAELDPVAFAWQPGARILGVIGTSRLDGKAGIYTFDTNTAEVATLYQATGEDILKSSLFWSGDGSTLLFTAQSTDPVSLLAGNGAVLRKLDAQTKDSVILSPDDVSVLPYGIQVR